MDDLLDGLAVGLSGGARQKFAMRSAIFRSRFGAAARTLFLGSPDSGRAGIPLTASGRTFRPPRSPRLWRREADGNITVRHEFWTTPSGEPYDDEGAPTGQGLAPALLVYADLMSGDDPRFRRGLPSGAGTFLDLSRGS